MPMNPNEPKSLNVSMMLVIVEAMAEAVAHLTMLMDSGERPALSFKEKYFVANL